MPLEFPIYCRNISTDTLARTALAKKLFGVFIVVVALAPGNLYQIRVDAR
jgi:hypothetical protein